MNYLQIFKIAGDKGCPLIKCKHCGKYEIECLKDGWCSGCYPYESTPSTQWAKGADNNLFILTLIQKWLRDEQKIIVIVRPYNLGNFYFTSVISEILERNFTTSKKNSYEESLNEGINEALKLI